MGDPAIAVTDVPGAGALDDEHRPLLAAVGRECLPPPANEDERAQRLNRDLSRYRRLRTDHALDVEIVALLTETDGQILITHPGVASSCGGLRRTQPPDRTLPRC